MLLMKLEKERTETDMNNPVNTAPRQKDPTLVITGKDTLFSYCNLAEPKSVNGGTPRFGMSAVVSKDDQATVKALRDGQRAAYEKYKDKLKNKNGSIPPMESIKLAIRDGDLDRPDDPVYANCVFVNANSESRPKLFDASGNAVMDSSEIYSGCYGKAAVSFFVFNTNGNRGIGCHLHAVQKIRDGEPLGGMNVTIADFMDTDDDEDLLG